jgi:hypothetical protein
METGAYVLGALAPAEREEYESHLARCPECRHEVAQLAVLPGLLTRLDPAVAEEIARDGRAATAATPPGTLLPQTLQTLTVRRNAQRRRRRWQSAGALVALVCLAVATGLGVDALSDRGRPAPPGPVQMTAMRSLKPNVPIQADVALVPVDGGTEVRMHCWYDSSSHSGERWLLHLVAVPRGHGDEEELFLWTAADGDDIVMRKFTHMVAPDIAKLEVRFQTTSVLVYEPS